MIALTISDAMSAENALLRVSELFVRKSNLGVPDAICIRNDTFLPEPFAEMVEMVSKVWLGDIILESDSAASLTKAVVPIIDREPMLVGANANNLEQFAMVANMFGCPITVSDDNLETLYDLAAQGKDLGVKEIHIDPMMRNMKQCLETCTDIKRISELSPELGYRVVVRTWSGEYAMTMATVSLLIDDTIVIVDDLDFDCCDTLATLLSSIR